jgi:hypothetical protein
MKRGMEIFQSNGKSIAENRDGSFSVPSQTQSSIIYEVRLFDTIWVCTCPDFENREIEACKHIHCVKFWIAANTYLQDKPKPKVLSEDAITCKRVDLLELSIMARVLLVNRHCFVRIVSTGLLKIHY